MDILNNEVTKNTVYRNVKVEKQNMIWWGTILPNYTNGKSKKRSQKTETTSTWHGTEII